MAALNITQNSIDLLTPVETRALRNARDQVNRTRDAGNQLTNIKQYLEYWLNESHVPQCVEANSVNESDRKKVDVFLRTASDAKIAQVMAIIDAP